MIIIIMMMTMMMTMMMIPQVEGGCLSARGDAFADAAAADAPGGGGARRLQRNGRRILSYDII